MPNMTGRSQIAAEVNAIYNRTLIERSTPLLVHNKFAVVRDIPQNGGSNIVKFRQYAALSANTTPLSAGVTPAGKAMSASDITATVLQYGDYVTIDDVVATETPDALLVEAAEELGEQAGLSLDTLCRDVIAAGTNAQYVSTATQTSEITAAMKLNRAEVKIAVRTLKGANARPVTTMINPTDGYNTMPIGSSFIGICSEDTGHDLDDATGWIPVEKYPNKATVMEGEIGSLANVRFIETSNAKVKSGEGADGNDVHCTLIFGRKAYAQTRIAGLALVNIVKPIGTSGADDPLDQRGTSGWKARYVARILDQTKLVRVEHGVTG